VKQRDGIQQERGETGLTLNGILYVEFEVFTAVVMKSSDFWENNEVQFG
jgi:hypothetical protein